MRVKFGDVVREVKNKVDRKNNPYEFYVAGGHIHKDDVIIRGRGRFATDDVGPAFIREFHAGQVLYVSRNAYLKKVAFADFDGVVANTTFVLETKNEDVLCQKLLPFVMLSNGFTKWSVMMSKGSTNPYVVFSDIAGYEFDLPPIDEQRKLARVLWAVNDTVEAYRRLMLATDELVRGRFVEMFGGIEEKLYLEDCCTVHARVGWQALKRDEYQNTGDYMLITGTDFKDGRVDYSTCVYVSKERYDMDKKIQVQNGDILITKDGTIGKVAIVTELPKPATLNAGVFVVRPDGRFNAGYFSYLFKGSMFASFVERVKTGSTIKHLNQAKLLKYKIPLAPTDLQQQFAEFVYQADKSKSALNTALTAARNISGKIISDNLG